MGEFLDFFHLTQTQGHVLLRTADLHRLLVAAREAMRDGDIARRDLDAVVLSQFLDGGAAR